MPKKIPLKLKGHYDSFGNPDPYAELSSYPQKARDYAFRADAIQNIDDPALLAELLGYDATPYEDASYDFADNDELPGQISIFDAGADSTPDAEPMASLIPSLKPQKKPTAGPVQFDSDALHALNAPTSRMAYRMPDNEDALLEKLWFEESLRYPPAPFDAKHPYGSIPGWPRSVFMNRDDATGPAARLLRGDGDTRIPSKSMAGAVDTYDVLRSKGELPLDSFDPLVTLLANTGTPSDPTNFNSNAGSVSQKVDGLSQDLGILPRQFRRIGRIPDWAKSPDTGIAYPDVVQQLHENGYHLGDVVDSSMPYLGNIMPDLAASVLRKGRNAVLSAPQYAKDGANLVSLFKKLT